MGYIFHATEYLSRKRKVTVECENIKELDTFLDELGENISFEQLCRELKYKFGTDNVSTDEDSIDNLESVKKYQFDVWEETEDMWEEGE